MRHRSATFSLLLFTLLFAAAALTVVPAPTRAGLWSGTTADHVASFDDNETTRAVQALVDGPAGGVIHAVWGEDAPSIREIHYGYSSDFGVTWTSTAGDRVISFPDGHGVNPEECDIARAPGGPLIVVWSEDVGDTREVHYGLSFDDGITWSSESQDATLSDPASGADTNAPTVAATEEAIHVVWTQPSSAGSIEVFYSRSTDAGATWSGSTADQMISFPDNAGAITPQIVVQGDGSLLVVWRETGENGPCMHAGRSTDGGVTWSSETADREISQPASLITNLAAAADPCGSETHVVYTASFDTQSPYHYEVYATSSFDHGATWTGESVLTAVSHDEGGGRSASNPDLFVGLGQGAVAVWDEEDDAGGTNEIHVSLGPDWTGAAADEIISFPDGEDGYRPSAAGFSCVLSADGGPRAEGDDTVVLWTEFTGGTPDNYEVHVSSVRLMAGAAGEPDAAAAYLRSLPNPARGAIDLRWRLPEGESALAIEIFDAAGRQVRLLAPAAGESGESSTGAAAWDRRDESGRPVPAGCYFARVRGAAGALHRIPIVLL